MVEMGKAAGRKTGDEVKDIMGRRDRACGLPAPFKHFGFYSVKTEKMGELEQKSGMSGFVDYFGCCVQCRRGVEIEEGIKSIS